MENSHASRCRETTQARLLEGHLGPAVELITQKHCSLGIRPEHYPIVGKHLLAAIQDVLGDAATDEVIGAWAEAYGFLAELFIGREKAIYQEQATAPGGWNGYRRFIVDRKSAENEIISSFYLKPEDGGSLPPFKPGQYITVKIVHPTVPTSPRNYSLSDRPGLGHYRISVKRELRLAPDAPDGLISNYLHDVVNEGDVVEVGPPCGEFTLDPAFISDRPIVLLSGGIGITPIMSMFKSLAHHGAEVPIHFVHAARDSRVHALADEVRQVAAQLPNARTHFRYDAPDTNDLESQRSDSVGFVDSDFIRDWLPDNDAEFYFCGPKPFMMSVYRALRDRGVDDARIHFEFFGPKQELTTAPIVPHPSSVVSNRVGEPVGSVRS